MNELKRKSLGLTIASQGLGMVTGGISSIIEAMYNTPKQQRARLVEAGYHPNAFLEMGSTGNIGSPTIQGGDPSSQFKGFTEGLIAQDIHTEGGKPFAPAGKNVGFNAMAIAGAKLASQGIRPGMNRREAEQMANIYNIQEGANKTAVEANKTASLLPGELASQGAELKGQEISNAISLEELENLRDKQPYDRIEWLQEQLIRTEEVDQAQIETLFKDFERKTYIYRNTPLNKIYHYIATGEGKSEVLADYIGRMSKLVGASGGVLWNKLEQAVTKGVGYAKDAINDLFDANQEKFQEVLESLGDTIEQLPISQAIKRIIQILED